MDSFRIEADVVEEDLRYCPKLRSGGMEYAFSNAGRYVRLVSDIPSAGTSGSWYDNQTKVSFDEINKVLAKSGTVQTRDFAHLFVVNTSHNGPMLVAALMNEGVLTKGKHGSFHSGLRRL
ncbi:hypothetical protein [Mailhella sp.]|uniref:hypothetical protein n=1 Tax=Mailhella sp. TaxID=1981029 RepID=UPI00406494D9